MSKKFFIMGQSDGSVTVEVRTYTREEAVELHKQLAAYLKDTENSFDKRLRDACADFGWGYEGDVPVFERVVFDDPGLSNATFSSQRRGWRLGNGTVVTPWTKTVEVPFDPERALSDIEASCNEVRAICKLPLLPLS